MPTYHQNFKNLRIPTSNVINHCAGHFLNAEYGIDIGEEIFTTCNFCHEYQACSINHGTTFAFRNYGVIESYPQQYFLRRRGWDLIFMRVTQLQMI